MAAAQPGLGDAAAAGDRGGGGGADQAQQDALNAELLAAAEAGEELRVAAAIRRGAEAFFQDEATGRSVLMAAAAAGHVDVVQVLLEYGAPWNALDRVGRCAGEYALAAGHQHVADQLLAAGVRAELIFGLLERQTGETEEAAVAANKDYLAKGVRYQGDDLLDDADRGVMMLWERPLMEAHADVLCAAHGDVLNVGFGLGLVDTAIQARAPRSHTIVEAHPLVYQRMVETGWTARPGVRVVFGRWQDVLPQLGDFDAVFFDTFDDVGHMREFHERLPELLRPGGVYSFFNGVCPENEFFRSVACDVMRIQLEQLGLDVEYRVLPIDSGGDEVWDGVTNRYYQASTYPLPIVRWAEPSGEPAEE